MTNFECPLCAAGKPLGKNSKTSFATAKGLASHLGTHKKRGDAFDMDIVMSQATTPRDDALRRFLANYAKVLPEVASVQPKQNDTETIMEFVTGLCKERGIKIVCPNCHTSFNLEKGEGVKK